ncbi:MAG TPA: signal recognition particle-docking protein FtsY [Candidatus Krumholzibacteria bacterium]|nr:signal recognition particle-docking protein FtsY [Candidatus Krumholzibacteria bacterium]
MFNLKAKLRRARESLASPLARVFQRSASLGAADIDEIEALLLSADVGVDATDRAVAALRERGASDYRVALRDIFLDILGDGAPAAAPPPRPHAIIVVGINGVGKTTSIGKLAYFLKGRGERVLMAACDTFRAAAADQLGIWAERAGVDMIRHDEGTDPAAVAFDACEAARARGIDTVIIDTAGRLHTRVNLMEELAKVRRVCERALGADAVSVLLVLDANLGQNSLVQAREFTRRMETSGIVLTKLDSTARGGIVIAIKQTLGIPVRYIGVGEGLDDFGEFSPAEFVDALVG